MGFSIKYTEQAHYPHEVHKLAINFTSHEGELYLAEGSRPDMADTIQQFHRIDPDISCIWTYVAGVNDIIYIREPDGWVARY